MGHFWYSLAAFSLTMPFVMSVPCAAEQLPVRGVWVANVASSSLSSPAKIREFVDLADSCGMNTLYVVTWNRGLTTYPSEVMQRHFGKKCAPAYADFDILQEVIEAAHAKNIRVIAWFEFGFSCSYGKSDGGHILRKYPQWAAKDAEGQIATKNRFQWMNAFHPEVQDFVLSLLKEVLIKYKVDGVQGDDRLPACPSLAGYDDWTVNLYREQHAGRSPPSDHFDSAWTDWRAGLLNDFMRRMHAEVKATSPQAIVSVAPSIYPWSKEEYLQDWPTWLENGWVDEVCPQLYREDIGSYETELTNLTTQQVSKQNLAKVFPGILVQTAARKFNDAANIRAMVRANREAGFAGEVFFYDAALREHREVFQSLYPSQIDR